MLTSEVSLDSQKICLLHRGGLVRNIFLWNELQVSEFKLATFGHSNSIPEAQIENYAKKNMFSCAPRRVLSTECLKSAL